MATKFTRISIDLQPPVARIFLCHPPVNVIDIAMIEELGAGLKEIDGIREISVLILASKLKDFSAGVDVGAHTPGKVQEMLAGFHGVIHTLVNTGKVSIASVQGNCLGGGAELAAVCDLAYTSESAVWGFPEIKLGCYPPVAATILSALVGQKHASDLILTGRSISGREAARLGLANRASPEAELAAAVQEAVECLVRLSPASLGLAKRAIYVWDAMHFDKGLARAERIYLDELMKTEDAGEGITAFLEKRDPVWKGK
jgi:cyclohexa-1,5-dienecarbonyl-CoA hydratase